MLSGSPLPSVTIPCSKTKAPQLHATPLPATPASVRPRSRRGQLSRQQRLHGSVGRLDLLRPNVLSPEVEPATPQVYTSLDESTKVTGKPRLVVLGSGWGAVSFIKALPANISQTYEVLLVSPRNYFLYTPLLPAVATGTMEERSIVEPVRNMIVGKGEFYEAVCKDIDPVKKQLVCCFPADSGLDEACFQVSYDVLVMGVGCVNNTFGIRGIQEHCNLFKSIEDANNLRHRVSECFERAALPQTPPEERQRLLSFVIVGGGPTGVEVAAELYDMIHDDLRKLYPKLIQDVCIRVVELQDHVLSTYDRAISDYTADVFRRAGVKLVLNSRVDSVDRGAVNIINKQGEIKEVKFGACVWATGVAMNPLVKSLQSKLEGQDHFRSILTDQYLEVKGSNGSIFALGDAATIEQPKALSYCEELFDQADKDHDNTLTIEELRQILLKGSERFSHLREHAEYLDSSKSPLGIIGNLRKGMSQRVAQGKSTSPLARLEGSSKVSREQFVEILKAIDSGLRALPATAQVARQQGLYLAKTLSRHRITGDPRTGDVEALKSAEEPFKYSHKGSAAYVGQDNAVFDVPKLGPFYGTSAGVVWKSFEAYSQFSLRNQLLVVTDFLRTKIFGRDISRV
uniref:NADH:ubiquinone reductase (non-electrogenic) n=1 Tax=Dunaliella tertiolecta TaxID=3047 RepID=A0A7S3QLS1_DUNTE|mmetsp:Transcript_21715/g.60224  ORF Transcript_21715/g.60224 Transcript_21715/m.60224 type:complete len:627 (+) Transcript_21715:27-1907(+)|eukprot:CAMPEP_0202347676 /NCGR_PEP_ID=MMETSP1126-20121109/5935_1 /ASSEMBLY_ACC=CAM_ASM_000457 /TAXON_ID=3047 /ORGANISM="Dunaliella tertiolecta, Strain CCMP1320" /LENGTH=626 /DNA_ID=CAMNT_0048939259 /DNA_START=29 /DNA_END=1909 /DNA_ORIENTATION=+